MARSRPPSRSTRFVLDQGSYILRVRPADGTRLPWVTHSIVVGPTNVSIDFTVPAPVYAGLQLVDPEENPLVNAVVRMFEIPTKGQAIEVGRAITDASGHYDMYLSPLAQ